MAVRYDQQSAVAKSSTPTPRASLTNGTSARKYVGRDLIENYDLENTNVRSNAEHLIGQAAGLRTTSMIADQAAEIGRARLEAIRGSIAGTVAKPKTDARTPNRVAESYDLSLEKLQVGNLILERYKTSTGHILSRITEAVPHLINAGVSHLLPSYPNSLVSIANSVVPQIDHVTVEMDKKKGTVDCFFSRMVFSLSHRLVTTGNIRAIRIFRSEIRSPDFTRELGRLSIHGVERMRADKNRSRSKNQDYNSNMEHRLREGGIDNAISANIPMDPFRKIRTGATLATRGLNIPPPVREKATTDDRAEAALSPYLSDPSAFLHLDKSVIENLNFLRNVQVQNPHLMHLSPIPAGTVRGDRGFIHDPGAMKTEAFRQNRDTHSKGSSLVVSPNNNQGFKEIAFIGPDKLSGQIVGPFMQYTFEDQSISFGRAYRYYVVTVDNNLRESVRSQIIEINVDGMRIPEFPKRVSASIINSDVALSISVDDQLVEKFEIYRKENDQGLKLAQAKQITHVSGKEGFTHEHSIVSRNANGFQLIGESINGTSQGGSTFYDRNVIRGRKYIYRIYSVDIFGNKSNAPREINLFVPDPFHKNIELRTPSILAEVDTATNKARITFSCEDPRVEALFLARRDLTVKQSAFTPPSEVNALKLGNGDHAQGSRRFEDVHLIDPSKNATWTGYFPNDASGSVQIFIDKTVSPDHYYQYQIHGLDRYGNLTSYANSRRIFTVNRPNIHFPLNLSADLSFGPGAIVQGVKLSWEDGNHDTTSEERLGDREKLNKNSVKTLYQLERRKSGDSRWFEYPLTEMRSFFDPTEQGVRSATPVAPNFRPDFVEINEKYEYRVATLQTGGFVSNFSPSVDLFVNSPIKPPIDFRLKSSDPKVRPFYVMLNWSTDASSAIVDKWEIERVEVNNATAERINTRNLAELAGLTYSPFTSVYAESSRFSAMTVDNASIRSGGRILPQDIPPHVMMAQVNKRASLFSVRSAPLQLRFGGSSQLSRIGGRFGGGVANFVPPPPPAAVRQGNGTIVGDHHFMDSSVQFGNSYFYRVRSHTPHGDVSEWIYRGVKVTESIIEIKNDIFLGPTYVQDPPNVITVSPPVYPAPPPTTFTIRPAVIVLPPPPQLSRYVPPPPPAFRRYTINGSTLGTGLARAASVVGVRRFY